MSEEEKNAEIYETVETDGADSPAPDEDSVAEEAGGEETAALLKEQCENKPEWLKNVEKYGLFPMGLLFVVSIVFSVINAYEFYKSSFNMLFMGLGCLFFSFYEGVLLYHALTCKCGVCAKGKNAIYIKIALGVAGFVAGLVAFLLVK